MQGIIERHSLKHAQALNERSHSMEDINFGDDAIPRSMTNISS